MNLNRVVVGEDVSTLSADVDIDVEPRVDSRIVLAAVVPVLCVLFHLDMDLTPLKGPVCLVGVKAGEDAKMEALEAFAKTELSSLLVDVDVDVYVLGGDVMGGWKGVGGWTRLMGDMRWGSGARRRLTAEEGVGIEVASFLAEPGSLGLGLIGVFDLSLRRRANFRVVPGGLIPGRLIPEVSAIGCCLRCFRPDTSPYSSSQEDVLEGSCFSSSSAKKEFSFLFANKAASKEE